MITNWVFISQMFSNKYWIRIFPFELVSGYIGLFRKIFGGFKLDQFFCRVSIINFIAMLLFIQIFVFFIGKIIKKQNLIKERYIKSLKSSGYGTQRQESIDTRTLDILKESVLICDKKDTLFTNKNFQK